MDAALHARAFASATGDDARYHALVYEEGGAAPKSLLVTPASDREIAARLREMGARDGGGVPMAAWSLREIPLVPWPDARVQGTLMRIRVQWVGWDRPREISELLRDPAGRGVSFRFGGNEEHDEAWESGCIACLYSCPGGVVSNERYTIRDRVREVTRFAPVDDLPPDGTAVVVTLEVLEAE
ncbi:MAG: YdjY domain-containing protein [Gemmatimonadota bacterium]